MVHFKRLISRAAAISRARWPRPRIGDESVAARRSSRASRRGRSSGSLDERA
jgi:hypothetical protein